MSGSGGGRGRIFVGWWVVAGAFVILTVSSGLGFYAISVYKDALRDTHDFSETAVSVAAAMQFLVGGVAGLFVARLLTRFDIRLVMSAGAVVAAVGMFLIGRVDEVWQAVATFAVFGVGFTASGLVPATTLVTRWFARRRSIALSITSTGLSLGGIVLTPVAISLIDDRGLADAMPTLAVIYVAVVVPVAWLLLRPDPAHLGLQPDGDDAVEGVDALTDGVDYEVARRSHFFVVNTSAYLLLMASQVGGIAHLFTVAKARVDSDLAAICISTVAGASVVARLAGGLVATRVNLRGMAAVLSLVQLAGLLLIAQAQTSAAFIVASLVFGASVGNLLMLQPLILADAFGVKDYARIYAFAQLFTTAGVAGGPALLGALFDLSDGWTTPFTVAAALSLVAGAVIATTVREVHLSPLPFRQREHMSDDGTTLAETSGVGVRR